MRRVKAPYTILLALLLLYSGAAVPMAPVASAQTPQQRTRPRTGSRPTSQRQQRQRARVRRSNINALAEPGRFIAMPYSSVSQLEQRVEPLEQSSEERWNYHQAYLHWLLQRSYPNDTVDWRAYAEAFEQRDLMDEVSFAATPGLPTDNPRWEFVGPQNLPVPHQIWYGQGTTSGRVSGVAFDASRPGVYYISTAGGGAWKTSDSGRRWTSLSNGPEWVNSKTSSVAVDSARNTVYVGTGDFDGGRTIYGYGLMKSRDGGATWENLAGAELSGHSVRRILIDPDNADIVTVAAGRHPFEWGKVIRTTNGGGRWDTVLPSAAGQVGADWADLEAGARLPNGKRYYYAVGYGDNYGSVYRSSENGAAGTWRKLTPPLTTRFQASLDVAASPTSPKTVYLVTGSDRKIWKSTNAGDTWDEITGNFPNGDQAEPFYNWSQHGYDCYITCSTRRDTGQDVIYVGLIDIAGSVDGGATWHSVGRTYTNGALTHNDQHAMAVNPSNPNEMLVGNDGGVYLVRSDPAAGTWSFDTSLNATLGVTQFYAASYHPSDPSKMIGGSQDNASPISTGMAAGTPLPFQNWRNVGSGDGGFCAINPNNPQIQYATVQFLSIRRTANQWATGGSDISYKVLGPQGKPILWDNEPRAFIAPIALDPVDPNILYAGTSHLWRWDDTTSTWTKRLGGQALASAPVPFITYIAVAPSDRNRIYTGSGSGEVWMSPNRGLTWKKISNGATPGTSLPSFWVTSIAVDPTNPDNILVGLSGTSTRTGIHPGHLWQCSNTSAASPAWANRSGDGATALPNIPLNAVVMDPDDPRQLFYVGTDVGFFISKDGGATWGNATTSFGLPNVQVNDLDIVPGTGYLMAATFGRGMWRIRFNVGVRPENFTFTEPEGAAAFRERRRGTRRSSDRRRRQRR